MVAVLSEWWLFYLSGGWCRPLPTTVGTSLVYKSVWLVVIGELHYLEKEPSNLRSDFAMIII